MHINKQPGRHSYEAQAFGWPAVSMWFLISGDSVGQALPFVVAEDRSIKLWKRTRELSNGIIQETVTLPTRPIWSGLAIGTAFYLPVLWLPLYGLLLVALRRRGIRRLKRGRCPKCRYDISGSNHENCPECGIVLS